MTELRNPTPAVDWETRPWWEACARGELVLQRCRDCGSLQHRPRAVCVSCLSDRVGWERASGRGTVYSFTITHQNHAPPFREALPYVLADVALEEGPRVLANLVGCAPADVRVGLPVVVDFGPADGDLAVPRFRPA